MLNGYRTDVTVAVWLVTLGVIVRHEQALDTIEMIEALAGLSVQASMKTEAGVTNCRLSIRPAMAVTVAVAVGKIIELTTSPVVTVVVVVTVLSF